MIGLISAYEEPGPGERWVGTGLGSLFLPRVAVSRSEAKKEKYLCKSFRVFRAQREEGEWTGESLLTLATKGRSDRKYGEVLLTIVVQFHTQVGVCPSW